MQRLLTSRFFRFFAYAIFLVSIRVAYTGQLSYLFLIWNLFLAWLPLYFSEKVKKQKRANYKFRFFLLSILFLPNAPYIITDLFHLKRESAAPIWLDTLILVCFAVLGALFFVGASRNLLQTLQTETGSTKIGLLFSKLVLMLLCGYGIYLGRYLRFNSWDLLLHPLTLFEAIAKSLLLSTHFKETLAITFGFAFFLFVVYELFPSNNESQL